MLVGEGGEVSKGRWKRRARTAGNSKEHVVSSSCKCRLTDGCIEGSPLKKERQTVDSHSVSPQVLAVAGS